MTSSESAQKSISLRSLLGLACISFALIEYEIALTRIFSAKLWYHFSFMAISLALYGLGASGLWVYMNRSRFTREKLHSQIWKASMAFAIALPPITFVLLNLPIDLSLSLKGLLLITFVYLLAAIPFFFGGLVVSLLLTHGVADSGRIYAFDLAGAATGVLVLIPLLNNLGAPTALVAIAGLGALAAFLFSKEIVEDPESDPARARRRARILAAGCAVAGLVGIPLSRLGLPLARNLASEFFANSPRYQRLPKGFEYYFDSFVKPAIAPILDAAWILCLLVAAAALYAFWRWSTQDASKLRGLIRSQHRSRALGLMLACAVLCLFSLETGLMRVWYAKGDFQFDVILEGWNSFSRVTVTPLLAAERSAVGGQALESFNWGLSDRYRGDFPEQRFMRIDSEAGTPINRFDGSLPEMEFLLWDVTAFGYTTFEPGGSALVIGAGGGRDVLTALVSGASRVTAVEINPLIVGMMRNELGDFTGRLYGRPDVDVRVMDGRTFIEGTDAKFDLIQASLIDTWAATAAGAYALSENSLYTIQAFEAYYRHLRDDGILTFSRFIMEPPTQSIRTLALMRETLDRAGVAEPERHLAIVRNGAIATLVLKRSPFTPADFKELEAAAEGKGYEWVLHPMRPISNKFTDLARADGTESFYESYPFEVRPPTDNRPFFFHMLRLDRPLQAFRSGGANLFNFQAVSVLIALFFLTLFLTVGFYLVPVWLKQRDDWKAMPGPKRSALVYYGLLGLGFMLVEIPFLQRFTLFLGHPTYSLAVVLFSILLFSGIGSAFSQGFIQIQSARRLVLVLFALVIVIVLENVFLDLLFARFQTAGTTSKVALSVLGLAPLGFLLGMPFPTALRFCSLRWPSMTPWAWAVNGTTSVMGTVFGVLMAMFLGFNAALLLGGLLYLMAAAVSIRWLRFVQSG